MPDENTIRHFRNRLIAVVPMDGLLDIFNAHLQESGQGVSFGRKPEDAG